MDSRNFPSLADQPEEQEEGGDVSAEVLRVMSFASDVCLTLNQYLELAQICLNTVGDDLADEKVLYTAEAMNYVDLISLMEVISRLEVACDIIAQIDLDPEEEGEDNED